MAIEYIKIDADTIEEVDRRRVDLKLLRAELQGIRAAIDQVKLWPDKVVNQEKDIMLIQLQTQMDILKAKINEFEAVR
jgi:hypothetical protein